MPAKNSILKYYKMSENAFAPTKGEFINSVKLITIIGLKEYP